MGWSLSSFLFQIVNFLVLVYILQRLVYRPLRSSLERRRQEEAARERALEQRVQSAKELETSCRERLSEIDTLRATTIRQATEQAHEERARLLAQAREDANAERARTERLLEAERESARAWVREMAVEHSAAVAGRLLLELAPHAVQDALFDLLLREIEHRAGELRAALAGYGSAEVEVTSVAPLSESDQQRLRAELARVVGQPPQLVMRDDPELMAGIVLRAAGVVLDASLAGELDVLRQRARGFALEEAGVA